MRKIIVGIDGIYGRRSILPSIPTIPSIKSKKIRQHGIGKMRRKTRGKTLSSRFSL